VRGTRRREREREREREKEIEREKEREAAQPIQMIYVHFLVARFKEIILIVVQYKYQKSRTEDQMTEDVILRTRLCGTTLITQLSWLILPARRKLCLNYFVLLSYGDHLQRLSI